MRRLSLTIAAVLISTSAWAQVARATNVLGNIDREKGTAISVTFDVPVDAVGDIGARLNIPSTVEYEDPRNRITTSLFVWEDGLWRFMGGGEWAGGHDVGKDGTINPPPMFATNVDGAGGNYDFRGKVVRVEIEVFRPIRVGVAVITRTP